MRGEGLVKSVAGEWLASKKNPLYTRNKMIGSSRLPIAERCLIAITAILGWIGLLIQFPLTIENSRAQGMTLLGGITAYLSFFTILTNLLIAIALTSSLTRKSRRSGFFTRPAVTSG
jgi:hypothetical protein